MSASEISFWTVAIYLVDRVYGGPEEGGWWYEAGERQDHIIEGMHPATPLSVLYSEHDAKTRMAYVQKKLDEGPNVGRRDIGSMLSTGKYFAQMYQGHPPARFPETRPHYE
jgi:hypothetical protein